IVADAASTAHAASTALPPRMKICAPAVAASGLPATTTQCRPCSVGLPVSTFSCPAATASHSPATPTARPANPLRRALRPRIVFRFMGRVYPRFSPRGSIDVAGSDAFVGRGLGDVPVPAPAALGGGLQSSARDYEMSAV